MALKETWQSYNETTKQYETSHPETEVSQVVGLAAAIEAGTKNAIDTNEIVNVPPPIEAGASCFSENNTTNSEELWRLTLSPQA